MLATVSDGGIERLDDLHVDDIDAGWKDPSSWVSAGLTAYGLALGIRRELGLDVTVALAFSLLDGQDTSEDVFDTQAEFEKQLDWSPPSLYLFKVGDQQHLSTTVRFPVARRYQVLSPSMAYGRRQSTTFSVCSSVTGVTSPLDQLSR